MKKAPALVQGKSRVQEACKELRLGHCTALSDEIQVNGVVDYLLTLLKAAEPSPLATILEDLVVCGCHGDKAVVDKSHQILSVFLQSKRSKKIPPALLRTIVQAFCKQLSRESVGLPYSIDGCEVFTILIKRLIDFHLWGDIETLLRSINALALDRDGSFQDRTGEFSQIFQDSAKETIPLLVGAFAKAKAGDRQRIKNLLHLFGEAAALPLIGELFRHPDKEVRIALFEMIPRKPNIIVPEILKRLAVKQPWFVLRNAIFILALLDDAGLFCLVKPFLRHPDHRVQKAVIDFIALVGSDEVSSDLLDAILVVDDRLLPGLVLLLQQHGGEDVEAAFLALLSDRHQITVAVRDEVVIRLCESGRLPNFRKTVEVLEKIVTEEKYGGTSDSQVAQAAENALRALSFMGAGTEENH